jgi:hypothetical protein
VADLLPVAKGRCKRRAQPRAQSDAPVCGCLLARIGAAHRLATLGHTKCCALSRSVRTS